MIEDKEPTGALQKGTPAFSFGMPRNSTVIKPGVIS
jgi:hypothetical protein